MSWRSFRRRCRLLLRGMLFEGWVPKRTPIEGAECGGQFVSRHRGRYGRYAGVSRPRRRQKYVFELLNARSEPLARSKTCGPACPRVSAPIGPHPETSAPRQSRSPKRQIRDSAVGLKDDDSCGCYRLRSRRSLRIWVRVRQTVSVVRPRKSAMSARFMGNST